MIESFINHKRTFIIIAAFAGILGCLIDLGATYFLGNRIGIVHNIIGKVGVTAINDFSIIYVKSDTRFQMDLNNYLFHWLIGIIFLVSGG